MWRGCVCGVVSPSLSLFPSLVLLRTLCVWILGVAILKTPGPCAPIRRIGAGLPAGDGLGEPPRRPLAGLLAGFDQTARIHAHTLAPCAWVALPVCRTVCRKADTLFHCEDAWWKTTTFFTVSTIQGNCWFSKIWILSRLPGYDRTCCSRNGRPSVPRERDL